MFKKLSIFLFTVLLLSQTMAKEEETKTTVANNEKSELKMIIKDILKEL